MFFLTVSSALLLDQLLGEAKRYHPLVGFGNLAIRIEKQFNRKPNSIFKGALALVILVTLPVLLSTGLLMAMGKYHFIFELAVLYWAIGLKSLIDHTTPIKDALTNNDLPTARHKLSYIVSRDTSSMESSKVISSTIESTLENGCDSVFASLFWYLVGGAPMVIAHRLINTLDAMWGYRTERFERFGKSAAIADDILNYVPARLTACSFAILGEFKLAFQCYRNQASSLASPNGGPVMCSGAGSLDIKLGGPTVYNGVLDNKPFFGTDNLASSNDIQRANSLVQRTAFLWVLLIGLIDLALLL